MGLKLRYSLFHGVQPAQVYDAYARFWAAVGHPVREVHAPDPHRNFDELDLYEPNNGWTILDWNAGWEYHLRRQAQMLVSAQLECAGLFIFVFDGDFWGYELFRDGVALDHFVQRPDECGMLFDMWCDCRGKPGLVAAEFPWVTAGDVACYLVQHPDVSESFAEYDRLDVPARPGDEFTRFAECAVLDFLRLLGVAIELRDHYVRLLTPVCRAFELTGWDEFPSRRRRVKPS